MEIFKVQSEQDGFPVVDLHRKTNKIMFSNISSTDEMRAEL